ncbi:hypothetical protein FBU30_010768 [Linnemannia zychae]|nr:hypothetical protein FBU30_010768 [Linnemannia zychae]
MDARTSYNPVRPLVIALCIILLISICLSCIRRRRAVTLHQQLAQQAQSAELGESTYIYHYPPPPGTPYSHQQPNGIYSPPPLSGQPLYTPPPGSPMMSQSPGGGQANFTYPPMPVPPPPAAGATSSTNPITTYVAPQDGSANLTSTDAADVPSVPPPPYTPAIPK